MRAAYRLINKQRLVHENGRLNTDDATQRLKEAVRRELLALAAGPGYCAYLKIHLPSEQKPERFLIALAGEDAALSGQNQAFYALVFSAPTSAVCGKHLQSREQYRIRIPSAGRRRVRPRR